MEIVSSYNVQILSENSIFKDTVRIYRSALSFLISAFNSEWDVLLCAKKAKERFNTAEHLVHRTKYNVAKYNFDEPFRVACCEPPTTKVAGFLPIYLGGTYLLGIRLHLRRRVPKCVTPQRS